MHAHIIVDTDMLSQVLDVDEIDEIRSQGRLRAALDVIAAEIEACSTEEIAISTEIDARTTGRLDDASLIPSTLDDVLIQKADMLRAKVLYVTDCEPSDTLRRACEEPVVVDGDEAGEIVGPRLFVRDGVDVAKVKVPVGWRIDVESKTQDDDGRQSYSLVLAK